MRTPLRLAIGLTAAVVIGALVATVASGFAAPQAPAPISAPDTSVIDAPVLGPASVDGVSTLPYTGNPLSIPNVIGQVQVVEPDLDAVYAAIDAGEPLPDIPLPADVLAAAAAIDAEGGDTPETPGLIADAAADAADPDEATPDDPCAAAEPEAGADDCPAGIHSAIFADTHLEPLEMWIIPAAHTSREGVSVWCEGAEPGAGELWLDVATNLPATVQARYWPADDPSDVRVLELPGVDSEVAAWQAEVDATGTYTPRSYLFQHCALLTGLAPNTAYVVSAFAIDTYTRISPPEEARFNSAGDPTAPTMFAIPLGHSLLYVGVPYAASQGEPTLRVAEYETGTEPPACDNATFDSQVQWAVAPHSVDISADYLTSHNYFTSYGKRSAGLLSVPEGSNLVVCALWFDSSAASFDSGTPSRYESLLASAPDTATPVFSVDSIRSVRPIPQGSLLITGSTTFGTQCGQWQGPVPGMDPLETLPVGAVLCDGGSAWSGGSSVALQITTSYLQSGGDRVRSAAVIRMRSSLCTGPDCALPPDSTYDVTLPLVTYGTGLCGSSFGSDCTPPTAETALGVATIAVHWEEGGSNGNTAWVVGTSVEVEPAAPRPDTPQFDVYDGWIPTLSADGFTGSATLAVRTDRPVDYTITVSGDCWKSGAPAPITGRAATADGAYFTAHASLAGLCPGSRYSSTITLVDDDGNRSFGSATTPSVSIAPTAFANWYGATFTVRQDRLEITARTQVLHGYPWNEDWWIAGVDLNVGNARWGNSAHFEETCFASDQNNIDGVFSTESVPMTETIHISAGARFAVRGLYYGHAPSSRCAWEDLSDYWAEAELDVTPAQLLRGILIEADFRQTIGLRPPARGHLYVWVSATRVTG